MLDLKPRVHFHEPESILAQPFGDIGDELDGARAAVAYGLCRDDRRRAHRCAHSFGQIRCRALLDDLLVAALQRAVSLEQVHRVAVCVGEHLHLDMARSLDATLYEHPVVAETGTGLAPRACERILEPGLGAGASHSLAAAARDRLHQHRKADPAGVCKQGTASSCSSPW